MTRSIEWMVLVYSLLAIFTFGHAFHAQPKEFATDMRVIGAALASIAWPLYLSTVVWGEV